MADAKKPVLGAQMYTLREFCKNITDAATTLKKVAGIGYTAVQISGFGPMDYREVAKAVADNGLTVAATHVGWNRMLNELDVVIEEHKAWHCTHSAIGGLPVEYFSADGLQKFLGEITPIARKLVAAGIDFSYHNHNHELARLPNGKTWLASMYEQADPALVKAELDVYWVTTGGGDPAAWVRKYAGRQPLLHLKDMCVGPNRTQRMAEIGEGNLNWPEILKAAKEAGVEWYLVEQDDCYERNPFESLAISYRNLRAMGLK